jgi:hypothetical protein
MAKAKALWAKAKAANPEDAGIRAQPRRAGGPKTAAENRPVTGAGLIQFNETEDAIIREKAGGNKQKEHFLRLIPTIEWRGNAERMRSNQLSPKNAAGAYQFIPSTAKLFGLKNRFDFGESAEAASKYYDYLEKQYKGNWDAMLADYNGGPEQAKKVLAGQRPVDETAEYLELANHYGPRFIEDTSRRAYTTQTMPEPGQVDYENVPEGPIKFDPISRKGKVAVGALDVATTAVSGLAGMAAGGLLGLAAIPFVGMEGADKVVKTVQDTMTWSPKSDYGKAFFNALSPVAETVDEKVKDTSMYLGRGNPVAATAIETGANAVLMLVGPGSVKAGIKAGLATSAAKGGGVKGAAAGLVQGAKTTAAESTLGKIHANQAERAAQQAKINKIAAELQENAKALGIELRRDKIHESVRRLAEGQSSPVRGAGFEMISKEANAARLREKSLVNRLWDKFRAQPHYTDVSWAGGTADLLAKELSADGFRVFESQPIMAALEDLRGLNTRITTQLNKKGTGYRTAPKNIPIKRQQLNELQAIRERLIKAAKANRDNPDGAAISRIGTKLDEMLDQQFKADAAQGLDAPWQAWKEAQDAYSSYKNNWNEFKAVRDIIADPDMTPQKLADTILGTSSLLGGKQASRLYDHLMQLTGNTPNMKIAVQGSVMYDLMKPLLDNPNPTRGNYRAVANNIRRFRKENPELIKAMGIKDKDLVSIQHAARAAEHTKLGDPIGLIDTALAGINRHLVGHEIAQAGFRVKLAEKVLNKVLKRDATSHREMLREFAGITEEPITSAISKQALAEAMIRGELANQYQNLAEWGDDY